MVRVDLEKVLRVEPVGFANAVAQDDDDDDNDDDKLNFAQRPGMPASVGTDNTKKVSQTVQTRFDRLLALLAATRSMPRDGHHLLCCHQYSVNVVGEDVSASTDVVTTNTDRIDLKEVLRNADGVLMGTNVLLSCARPWIWQDPERVPNTFPVVSKKTEGGDGVGGG